MWGKEEHFSWGKTEHLFNPLPPIQLSWNIAGVRGEKITQSSMNITQKNKSKPLEISLQPQIKLIQSTWNQHITKNQNLDTKK